MTRDNPKTTRNTPTPDDVEPIIRLVEMEGFPLSMLKTKLIPPLKNNP
jgi:hypothetical protein